MKGINVINMTNRNATPSINGWFFQICAGIYLFFKNIKNNNELKIEGENEDVEIYTDDGKKIYAQVKSIENVNGRNSVSTHYNKALKSLKENSNKSAKLIYFSNITNPFNSKEKSFYDYGSELNFNDLTLDVQKKIRNIVGDDFDYNNLYIEIVYFYGTDESKKKLVKKSIGTFLSKMNLSDSKTDVIYDALISNGLLNASKRYIKLKKEDIVYKVIVPFLVEKITIDEFQKIMAEEYYDDCINYYEKFCYSSSLKYSQFTKISSDFNNYKKNNQGKNSLDFIREKYENFLYLFDEKLEPKIREGVTKLMMYKIIQKRLTISSAHKEANL